MQPIYRMLNDQINMNPFTGEEDTPENIEDIINNNVITDINNDIDTINTSIEEFNSIKNKQDDTDKYQVVYKALEKNLAIRKNTILSKMVLTNNLLLNHIQTNLNKTLLKFDYIRAHIQFKEIDSNLQIKDAISYNQQLKILNNLKELNYQINSNNSIICDPFDMKNVITFSLSDLFTILNHCGCGISTENNNISISCKLTLCTNTIGELGYNKSAIETLYLSFNELDKNTTSVDYYKFLNTTRLEYKTDSNDVLQNTIYEFRINTLLKIINTEYFLINRLLNNFYKIIFA